MGKSTSFSNDFLKLIFNADPIANIADNAAVSPLNSLSVALHTADPGTGNDQSASEISYVGYVRQTVARTAAGWSVTANSVKPVANIVFPVSTGGTPTATHWSIGVAVSGATNVLYSGTISPNMVISTVVVNTLTNDSIISEN